ncbi:MAG: discoidin domain-containing protein [Candidatus Eisenbacteria bacterium]|nr:discoidin domain-containing protein [Candidatus Eisenbacteria bacterium]
MKNGLALFLLAAVLSIVSSAGAADTVSGTETILLDDFASLDGWTAHPSDGVEAVLREENGALRVDFRFLSGAGYAVFRKDFAVNLPENYAFTFRVRGDAPPNHLEFKLIDATGENVWWSVLRDHEFPNEWETIRIKKRKISFAWGPAGGGEPSEIAAIEFAVTAGSGGSGTVWIDDLALTPLPPPNPNPPAPVVAGCSSFRPGHEPEKAIDGDDNTYWSTVEGDTDHWIEFDLGVPRELSGLYVLWHVRPRKIDIRVSDDGNEWRLIRDAKWRTIYCGGVNFYRLELVFLPETEATRLRLDMKSTHLGIKEIRIQPLEWAATRNDIFERITENSPRGMYPRGMTGEAVYWTTVGADGGIVNGLISEDGAVEVGPGSFSIEPFLFDDLYTTGWDGSEITYSLKESLFPVPTVTRRHRDLLLEITAFAVEKEAASSMVMHYRLRNKKRYPQRGQFLLALRPFQVNPPYQFLNVTGGTARVDSIENSGSKVRVNGRKWVFFLRKPDGSFPAVFEKGMRIKMFTESRWGNGYIPFCKDWDSVTDPFGAASAVFVYPYYIPPGEEMRVDWVIPLDGEPILPEEEGEAAAAEWVDRELEKAIERWRERLGPVTIDLPDKEVENTLKSQIGYILVNRAGPAIRPGTRSYARSWIRDGALTSSALLRLGIDEPAREFLEWFAPHQYESGKIPCVVDDRGADPVPEHDSSGEFLFLIAEIVRYTKDRALADEMWPRAEAAAAYLDSLRGTRRTDEYRTPEKRHFFGLLPPSISHEGYSAKPMHSYWDDFWALRGFRDAAYLAGVVGREAERERWAAVAEEFAADLAASIAAAMEHHGIDYVPGCADLGDFDPTSTTIALSPVGAGDLAPEGAIRRTFERYGEFFEERRTTGKWEAFTPYELRNIGAFARLGMRGEIAGMLEWFLRYRRPQGWNHWAEVVWKEERLPRFIGDMPHTWVGSDFIRSVLDMLAFVRESDGAIVVGAGIPVEWLAGEGVSVKNLQTPYGTIGFIMLHEGEETRIDVEGTAMPPGGIELRAPFDGSIESATVNGAPASPGPEGEILVRALPARVVLKR